MTTQLGTRGTDEVMDLLRHGIPLTLLLDLADPFGPHSDELFVLEGSAA